MYKSDSTEMIQQALPLFQRALKRDPKGLLGYYSLGRQLLYHANNLIKNNALLVDYEIFLNQAFKNLYYVKTMDEKNTYAALGIAEIALILYQPYINIQNNDIADRLIYNALVNFENIARKSTDFTVLYNLGQLQIKMAVFYLSYKFPEKAYNSLTSALTSFKNALTSSKNYSYIYLYHYYVDYAELWFNLYRTVKILPPEKTNYLPTSCLKNAMECIDTALTYNSVYGIEAVEIRNRILQENDAKSLLSLKEE
jgi:hypothetical protein